MPWGRWDAPKSRPPWWPEDEPWPPQGPPWTWRRRGSRLVWRIALAVLLLWLLASAFFGFVGWFAASRIGGPPFGPPFGGPPHDRPPFFAPFGFLFFVLLLVGLVAAARSLRRLTIPVGGLMEAAGRVAQGRYEVRVRETGPPEMQALARAFNQMTERLQAHEQQRRDLLADVTHELRTPLAVIQGNLEGLLDGVYPRDDAHLTPVLEEARVLSTLIEDLRTLALAETGTLELHREPTDLSVLIEETLAAFGPAAQAAGVRLDSEVSDDLPLLQIDPTRIRQVLANLIRNALQHTPSGGSVRVTCHRLGGATPQAVVLAIADTGRGITPEDLPHVFERFYKSRESRGTGLGLAIARNLVAVHGGSISADSTVGNGTTITITLPEEASAAE